ncbi:MAG: S8 family serine peptidase [Rothia sp. (in: high G+C Gram-positive bacteria)]|nr:S8 family serine peptidase [Rothia sp. (in: high G+C Gram-positive bacteria)]
MKAKQVTKKVASLGAASMLSLGMVLTLGLPTAQAAEDARLFQSSVDQLKEDTVLTPSMQAAEGQVSVYVQFRGAGAYESTQPLASQQDRAATSSVDTQSQVQAIAAAVQQQGQSAADQAGASVLYTTHNTLRGVALRGDAAKIRELASRSDVVKISPIVSKTPSNTGTTIDTQAIATWQQTGFTGQGVKIAIIDTGVDYTHTQFGGPGTAEAYQQASALSDFPAADSGLYDPEKYLGGYDLAGDNYNANDSRNAVPQPDGNPLDCKDAGHGTHVAGTAAGYAVQEDGSPFKGDYTSLTAEQMKAMSIGAGSAPGAQIVDFRVFGCSGSTDLTGLALDRALDPNGDGKYDDRVDVVNMSLGSDFGATDDPENALVDALTRQGVLSVVAAGNSNAAGGNGDTYSISGNPANARSALAVANSIGSTTYVDKAEITAPASIAGPVTGDYSVNYDYASASPEALSGEIVMAPADNRYACDAFPAGTDFAGKWVFIDWADETGTFPCGSAVRFNNLEAAGAKGVVLASSVEMETTGIAGNKTIPGVRLNRTDAQKVRQAVEAGQSVKISLKNEWIASTVVDSGMGDQLNPSSARGVHGSIGYTKPDVAAPGTNIGSAAVAGGSAKAIMSGTSMATPHVAGVAALVIEANQSYSASDVKAAIMNSAVHDITTDEGLVETVERVGSGRVDALKAVNQKVLVYNADHPDQVSESFGVVEVDPNSGLQTYSRELILDNSDSKAHTYQINFEASSDLPGVSFSAPQSVRVEAGQQVRFTVRVTVDPAQLEKKLEGISAAQQLDVARQHLSIESGRLQLTEADQEIRLPLQIAPKPVASMGASSSAISFANDSTEARVDLEGSGLNQGGYTSLLGAYQLGQSSDRIQSSTLVALTSQRVDLQYVGASSNVPALQAAGQPLADQALMSIGISTWSNWENLTSPTSIEVGFDLDNNNRADYYLFIRRATGLDYPLAALAGYRNGQLVLIDSLPVNGAFGDVDTNTFDSNTLDMPVDLTKMGITAENAGNLRYQVNTFSNYEPLQAVDGTGWISYNPYDPKVWFEGGASDSASLFLDQPDQDLTVHRSSADETEARALLLHMHNGTGDLTGLKAGEDGAKAEVLTLTEESAEEVSNPYFTDVKPGDQFYTEIAWMAQRGITTGYPDGSYRPLAQVERGAMAAFFYRMAGSPQYTAPSTSPFSDVPTSHQFYKEIAWMESMGITTGYADGTFRPNQPVNRDAMAAFFYRYAGKPAYTAPATSRFKDVASDSQFYKEISWLASVGISQGWEDGTYRPVTPIARDAMAAFIYRYDQNVASR